MTEENRALVPSGVVALPIPVEQAVKDWEQYQDLCRRLLDEADYQTIGVKRFRKKSGWRKLARAFNITDEIVASSIQRDDGGRVISAEFTIKATAPNGRSADGWASCSIAERGHDEDILDDYNGVECKGPCDGRKHFSLPDHTIPATAHTRAKNRAISDLIGAGEVSAEEIEGDERPEKKVVAGRSPAEFRITFGKHSGRTLGEVMAEDRGYVEWLSKEAKSESLRQAAKAVLTQPAQTNPEGAMIDAKVETVPTLQPSTETEGDQTLQAMFWNAVEGYDLDAVKIKARLQSTYQGEDGRIDWEKALANLTATYGPKREPEGIVPPPAEEGEG